MGASQFYAVAAQVIPVLLLVLAVEQRAFDAQYAQQGFGRPRLAAAVVVAIAASIMLAEVLALWGAASGSVFAGHPVFVAGALATLGVMVLTPIVGPWVDILLNRDGRSPRQSDDDS